MKLELTGLPNRLDVRSERMREVKNDTKFFGPSNWKNSMWEAVGLEQVCGVRSGVFFWACHL